ncbi:hypothetical protein KC331_g5013 [Hortaea werneckii]|uniref:Mitochondrial thiamine pyrophosphate carrier 1 n=1 Tax=Hortaea werneckii TaxID=91943 RepID=A0A3M7CHG0_HORWE|nr:hypothetical protein KC331_g5013 [Hortaea werneckii]KAI7717144.1 hypothetical protein KC353_g4820 [Hortaea werneckii]RMY51066.1 hypothetical protein D0865_06556 [Hortaea werneckii]
MARSPESAAEQDARLKALWLKLNTKRKDTLDLPALKLGLQQINHPLKDADTLISDMLTACDINKDGKISYDEFLRFCKETEKQLWALFNSIDRDANGHLDKGELSAAFERAGVSVSQRRLDVFFSYIDRDDNGTIDFAEWRDFLLFMPTNSPGLKAVFSYYTSTVKVNAEGDVNLSDEALSGLGTILPFLHTSLFGAITQLVRPSTPAQAQATAPISDQINDAAIMDTTTYNPATKTLENMPTTLDQAIEDDPYIPIKPARRKQDEPEPLRLIDFVPDVGYFIAGGISGITSRTATAPLDRLKVYLIAQTGQSKEAIEAAKHGAAVKAASSGVRSLWNAVRELWAAGGMRSLFAGNGLNIVKVMPESAVKFGSYEASKRFVAKFEGHNDPKSISAPSQFAAGGVAGMISQAVVYPLDTLKFRMQCETVPGGAHGNRLILQTAQRMWAKNGVFSFYRGLPMGLVGMFPYAAIDLFTFETLKKTIIRHNMKKYHYKNEEDALPGNFSLALMGGLSGAFGASMVYPLNLLRTRLQSQGTTSHPRTYSGVFDVTRQTIKYEGVRGLFKGLTPNLLKVVPAVSITYVVYENTKKALHLH